MSSLEEIEHTICDVSISVDSKIDNLNKSLNKTNEQIESIREQLD